MKKRQPINIPIAVGQPFAEWIYEQLDKRNITTARVYLLVGAFLGFLLGISGTLLTMLIIFFNHPQG